MRLSSHHCLIRSPGWVTMGPTIIIKIAQMAQTVTQFPMVLDRSSLALAPKYWETMIPAPVEIPINNTSIKLMIGDALPTAASALSPT